MQAFGDGFDLYATTSDPVNQGYWTSGNGPVALPAGRFSGSRCLQWPGNANLAKSGTSNDALHHFSFAFQQTATLSGSTNSSYFTLLDGATAQCSVVFRPDGAIMLQSGGVGGTTLATYTGAVTLVSTWYQFEVEVFISNTAGYMNVRKNGNTVNDFSSATNLNTRSSANNYANSIQIGESSPQVSYQYVDDFLWRSDPTTVPWVGDIRCYTRMPASDVSKLWTPNSGTTNYTRVNEAQQDGITTYVSDSNVGDADFYSIAATTGTPTSVVCVTTRGLAEKSDAGTRSAAVQLKSGATTVASTSTALNTSFGWLYRTDFNDPNTSAAWTAAGVNGVQIGPVVTA